MKVVFATYDSGNDVGGVSSWLQRLLPRLKAAGVEVEVHVMAFGGQPGVNCAGFANQGIPYRWWAWEADTGQGVRHCLKLIEESQPDVYVPNCILPAYYAAGYARRQGVHTVGVLHSDDPFYWGIVDEFVSGSRAFRLSAVVSVSQFLQAEVEKRIAPGSLVTRQIGCGVPIASAVAKPALGVFRLVYTGRLVEEQKRISEVTRALCAVVKQNAGVEAWIVGDGVARGEVERIIAASGVEPQRVKVLGRVASAEIYGVLRECHAFVLLSDYEGLPVAMLEAMSAGVVPVCLDMRSGIREAMQHGFNGLIVKDRQDDFYAAIQTLQRDLKLWAELSGNARATVRQKYSEEVCATSWIELLGSFESRKRRSRVKSPVFIRLPRRNAKFGNFDQRLLSTRSRIRMTLGLYRRKVMGKLIKSPST